MTTRSFQKALPERRLELGMPDQKAAFGDAQARAEAERCLFCHDAPCIAACPTAIDVPEFIRRIATGNVRGSAKTILSANVLGYSCALVCPVEVLCVGACVYNHMGRPPIQIGLLQRFAVEHAYAKNARFFEKGAPTGFRVACVGAGPASLACAHELTRLGHEVVCLEKRLLPGGLNTTGCAPYKIRSETALREVEYVQGIGFEVRTGVEVGKDVTAAELENAYDAIFLGIGLGDDSRLRVPGEDAPGVFGACALIERIKNATSESMDFLSGVTDAIVVGGGNTGVDIARQLARLKVARVTQLYRRGEELLSAYRHEVAHARKEGVSFRFSSLPVAYAARDDGHVGFVRVARTHEGPDGKLELVSGSEEDVPAQLVAVATGQEKLAALLEKLPGIAREKDGSIAVEKTTGATTNPRWFAGGDAANGGKEVVYAAAEGKLAAKGIDAALRAGKLKRRGQ